MDVVGNWVHRSLFVADNIRILRGMNSKSVDCIATDPPFNSKRAYFAPFGSMSAGQRFDDCWRWDEVTDEWQDLIASDHPKIKELIEAAAVIEGGSIDHSTGKISTGRVKNSIAVGSGAGAPTVESGGSSVAFAPGLNPAPMVTFPAPATSNRTYGFPVYGFPVGYLPRFVDRWNRECFLPYALP